MAAEVPSGSGRVRAQGRQRQSLFGANARARRLTDTNAGTTSVEFQHSDACNTCGVEFDIFNRRHHCRHCGQSFCDVHCRQVAASRVSQSDGLFDDLFEETVRLCDDCISNMRKGVRGLASPDLEALRRRRRRAARRRRRTHQADTGASPNSMGGIADMDDSTSDGRQSFFDSLLTGSAAAFASSATEAPSEGEAAPGAHGAREGIEGGGTGGGEGSSDMDTGGLTNYASRLSALWADNPAEMAADGAQNRSLTERIFGPSPNEHITQAMRARAPSDGSSASPRHERAHSDGGRTDGEGITDGEGYVGEAEGSANEGEPSRRESIEDVLSSYAGRLSLLWGSDSANAAGASPSPVASASASASTTTTASVDAVAAAASAAVADTTAGASTTAIGGKPSDASDAVDVQAEAGDTGSHGLAAAAAAFLYDAEAAPATGAAFEPSARAAAALEQQRQQRQQPQQESQPQQRDGSRPRRRRSSTGGDTQLPPGGTLAAISNALSVFSSGDAGDGASDDRDGASRNIAAANPSESLPDVTDEAALLREQLRRMQEERDHYKLLHEQNEQTGDSSAQAQAQLLLEREQHAAKQMNQEQEKNRHQLKKLKSLDRRHQQQLSRSATKDLAYALRRQHDFVLRSSFIRWCTATAQLAEQEQELAAAAARQRAARGKAPATLYAHVHAAEFLGHGSARGSMSNDALLSAGEELRVRVTHAESGEVRMSQQATVKSIMHHEASSNEMADDDAQDDEASHRAAFNVAWTASEHASDLAFAFGTTAARGGDTATLLAEVLRPAGMLTDDEDVVATTLLEMPPLEQGESTQAMWVPIFRAAADGAGNDHGGSAALEPAGELLVTVWRELAVERKRQSGASAAAGEKLRKGPVAQLRSSKANGEGGSLHDLLSPRASVTAMNEADAERQRSSPRKLRRRAPHALPAPIKTAALATDQGAEPSSPAAFASWGLAPAAEAAQTVDGGAGSPARDSGDDVLGVGPTPSGRSYKRGSVLVEVRMARGLRDVHALGTQEPYVLAKLCGGGGGGGSISHRTRPCAGGGTHPRWSTSHNNRMVFDLRDAARLSRAQARARAEAGEPGKPERPLTLSFELWSLSVAMDTTIGVAQLVLPNDPADLARRGSWFLPVSTGGALEVGVEHVVGTPGSLRLNRVSGAGLSSTEPRERWRLCMRVLTAHALENVQTFGEQNPYVAGWLEDVAEGADTQEQRTDARHGTNPTWSAQHANLLEFSLAMNSRGSDARHFDPVVFRVELRNENLALDDTIGVTHMDFSASYLQELAAVAARTDATEPNSPSPSKRRSSGGALGSSGRGRASSAGGSIAGGAGESRAHKRVLPIDTGGSLEVAVWLRRVVDADSAHGKVVAVDERADEREQGMERFAHADESDEESYGDGGRDAGAGASHAAQEETAQAPSVPGWVRTGELTLEVTRAKGLKDVQAIGAQDPYVRVHLLPAQGNEVCSSLPVSGGGTDPVWSAREHRAAFTWVLGRDSREQVHSVLVEVWNDNISFDELIGTCLLRLPHERATLGEAVWFPVNTGGYLECRIGHTETPQTQLEADTLVVEQRDSLFQSFA